MKIKTYERPVLYGKTPRGIQFISGNGYGYSVNFEISFTGMRDWPFLRIYGYPVYGGGGWEWVSTHPLHIENYNLPF